MEHNEHEVNQSPEHREVTQGGKSAQTKQIVSALVVLVTLACGAFLLRGTKPPIEPVTVKNVDINTQDATGHTGIRSVTSDEHVFGDVDAAQVVIVEYSDTECPFCKMFHATMHQIVAHNGGRVAWVYRHFPIAQLHPKAFHEAEATECAWEQGGNEAFWAYTNEVYSRTNSNNSLPVEQLSNIAMSVGLNLKAFNTCLRSGKFADKVNGDITDGKLNGVQGTPTSFILVDGKVVDMIDGAQALEGVQAKIDAVLK
jgi:protein-disulfide isomerase